MNETIKNILGRRSIRAYQDRQIPEESLSLILECGQYAATAMGRQPWHFTVVQDREVLNEIVEENRRLILESGNERMIERAKDPNFDNFHHAPTVIIVSADDQATFGAIDCANALQNMAVAAHSLGLGSCYIASFLMAIKGPRGKELLEKLGIPEGYTPISCISVGYSAVEAPEPAPRRENTINYIR